MLVHEELRPPSAIPSLPNGLGWPFKHVQQRTRDRYQGEQNEADTLERSTQPPLRVDPRPHQPEAPDRKEDAIAEI